MKNVKGLYQFFVTLTAVPVADIQNIELLEPIVKILN